MGDSVREYLERLSTPELKAILFSYSRKPFCDEYEDSLIILKDVLKNRKDDD